MFVELNVTEFESGKKHKFSKFWAPFSLLWFSPCFRVLLIRTSDFPLCSTFKVCTAADKCSLTQAAAGGLKMWAAMEMAGPHFCVQLASTIFPGTQVLRLIFLIWRALSLCASAGGGAGSARYTVFVLMPLWMMERYLAAKIILVQSKDLLNRNPH